MGRTQNYCILPEGPSQPRTGTSDADTEGDNTSVVGIDGNFDDAQNGVKKIFNDKEFEKELAAKGYQLSSANSINIGRLVPQIVYYVYAYEASRKR